MKRTISIVALGCAASLLFCGSCLYTVTLPIGPAVAHAEDGWKAEYQAVCSRTELAMTHTVGELKALIARCDQLKPRIEAEEESTRKVYLRRLQMCRELYQYVLDSKAPE